MAYSHAKVSRRKFARARGQWLGRVNTDARLTGTQRTVATHLAMRYMNMASGLAWPSHYRIARELGFATKTVQRAMQALAKLGYLRLRARPGRTNVYSFDLSHITSGALEASNGAGQESPGGRTEQSRGAGPACPPNLKNEPDKEPERTPDELCFARDVIDPSSPAGREWNKFLEEKGHGNLQSCSLKSVENGKVVVIMPFGWPPNHPDQIRRFHLWLQSIGSRMS